MSGSLSSAEGELNAIIKEYLEYSKLNVALNAFERECQKLGKPIQDNAGKSRKDEKILKIKNELLQYFDTGQRSDFFFCWEKYMTGIPDNDLYYLKLEFNLHLHFAVFPLRRKDHWVKTDVEESMANFRYYLETQGSVLSKCSELLPYYALPYISSPSFHPSFQDIFQDVWVTKLRNKLDTFVWECLKCRCKEDSAQPRLIELYNNSDLNLRETQTELKSTKKKLNECKNSYSAQSVKLSKLQDECQQLMSVASLLVTALESALKGNMVDLECVLSNCAECFPEAYKLKDKANVEPDNSKKCNSLCDLISSEPSANDKNDTSEKTLCSNECQLSIPKIKECIFKGDDRSKLLLLQALRWKLTKANTHIEKEKILNYYIDHDLLGINNVTECEKFVQVVNSASGMLLQSICRLLNAFASFSKGRAYLSGSTDVLHMLLEKIFIILPEDSVAQDMILATLQKLSMRNASQIVMIEGGAIKWLVDILKQPEKLCDYGLEYAVALLMNLCLCPLGRKNCSSMKEEVIPVFQNLFQLNKAEITGYINGALYSIFAVPDIRAYAKEQHFDEFLVTIMKKCEPDTLKQLECIHSLLSSGCSNDDSEICSSEDEQQTENQDDIILEPELDDNDPVCAVENELAGEFLLKKCYLVSCNENSHSKFLSKNKVSPENNQNQLDSFNYSIEEKENLMDFSNMRSSSVPLQTTLQPSSSSSNNNENHCLSEPVTPKLDLEATQLVRKIVGQPSTTLVEAVMIPNPSSVNIKGLNVNEYAVAFSSRPKIPRTPELSPSNSARTKNSQLESYKSDILHSSYEGSDVDTGFNYSGMPPKVAASSPPPHTQKIQNSAYI